MIIFGDRKFIQAPFDNEDELERVVVRNAEFLFGPSSLYLAKALIETHDGFGTIPDGFAIDLASRKWFIVEAELLKHSVWSHIAPQIAKQIIAARLRHGLQWALRFLGHGIGKARGHFAATVVRGES